MNEVQMVVGLGPLVVGTARVLTGKAWQQVLLGGITVLCGGALALGLV